MKVTDVDLTAAKMPISRSDPKADHDRTSRYHAKTISKKAEKEASVSEIIHPSADRIMFSKLEGANAKAQSVAQKIRSVDNTMGLIEKNVHQMDSFLEKIVKNYPPYPIGHHERIQALRQFSGLRKMIDQLTLPPPADDSPEKIMGDATALPHAGDWQVTVGAGQAPLTIKHQPLHTGADGLDIPELPSDAPDEDVQMVLDKVQKAQQTLHSRRRAFVADANRVIGAMI